MNNNDDFYNRQMQVIDDNVNVGKTSDGKEFLILVGGLIGVIILVIMFADAFANVFINCMSVKTQLKIESMFGKLPPDNYYKPKYKPQLRMLQRTRYNIIRNDEKLQGMSPFPIIVTENKDLNAWVVPNGTIYFTTTLLDKNFSEEELAFILAHEIGHYRHRDHLKTMSRQIIIASVTAIFSSSQGTDLSPLISNVTNIEYLSHSRGQERRADLYANRMLMRLYGTNRGGVEFFKYLEKEHSRPEYLQYFTTHPSPHQRLKLINR